VNMRDCVEEKHVVANMEVSIRKLAKATSITMISVVVYETDGRRWGRWGWWSRDAKQGPKQASGKETFTLYQKMAAVRQIQWNIKVGDLSIWAACGVANLHNNAVHYLEKRHCQNAGESMASVILQINELSLQDSIFQVDALSCTSL